MSNSDDLLEKVTAFGERLKITSSEVSRKVTESMTSMSYKMKELFNNNSITNPSNQTDQIIISATSETLTEPDWSLNLEICDAINAERVNSVEVIRGIKKRLMVEKDSKVQLLSLVLLETVVKNCEKAFSEVAAERVLDEMVKIVDDVGTVVNNRNKVLCLIEAWGESGNELRYLPVYEETYKSLKSRGIRFPGRDNESLAPIFTPPQSVIEPTQSTATLAQQMHRELPPPQVFSEDQTKEVFDVARNSMELLSTVLSSSPQQDALEDDLTITLMQQCRQSQYTIQNIIETAGDNEALLFEALNMNDEIQKLLSKCEELKKSSVISKQPEPAMIPVAVEPEESLHYGKEDALIRKPSGSQGPALRGGDNDDDGMMDDLDEMIFGRKSSGSATSEGRFSEPKKTPSKDDLISF